MSYVVDLIVSPVPADDESAWKMIEECRERYFEDSKEPAPVLVRLHKILTAQFPCLSSYESDDPEMENCPWGDGPMINNFSSEMGTISFAPQGIEEGLPFVVYRANELGITVADSQWGKIFRPEMSEVKAESVSKPVNTEVKPWWKFW